MDKSNTNVTVKRDEKRSALDLVVGLKNRRVRLAAAVVAERLPVPPPPQYSYHNMFVAAAESAALWRCKSCGKEVSNRWHHFHSHTAQRSLCPYCPATYSRIDTLRSHLRLKHAALLLKH
ncbi:hypothetical protein MSG28_008100 [Choristoneura fumiferana]|uniref:Uncharacterized protein n=1 Tax=Choristoneura fumiferana TaxID=7141 RepID=A0ACC0JA30_CHOFU|nr:hypothetical protein MSG28_008100 [Choristoneura fumiferana]